jgi:dolichyl-diphosphooligosaccharide--protein glycosyltransferase
MPARDRWLLLGIALAAVVLRVAFLFDTVFRDAYVNFQDNDSWYHMRLIDNLVRNFPHPMLVDPYFGPEAQPVAVAPLFDLIVAAVAWVVGLGRPSPHTIDVVGAVMPPVLGALVPLPVYWLGRRLFGRVAGLLAAALVAVAPGHFLARSVLGYTDHHVAEALFSTVAILMLVVAVREPERARRLRLAGVAGLALAAYFLTWTGAALLVFVVCAWVIVQDILDALHGRGDDRIGWVTLPALAVATTLVLLLQSRAMWRYGTQLAALLGGLALIVALEALRRVVARARLPRLAYPVVVLAVALLGALGFAWQAPALARTILLDLARFTPGDTGFTVSEVRPLLAMTGGLSWQTPLEVFGTPFVIGLVTLPFLAWRAAVDDEPAHTLVVVWSAVIVAATLGQNRFGYYLVINLALLTGYAAARALAWAWSTPAIEARSRQARRRQTSGAPSSVWRAAAVVAIAAVVFLPNATGAWRMARTDLGVTRGWHASLEWLRRNTPEPFASPDYYFARYQSTALLRPQYVVMTWWDYGYQILRVARRVPVANPTQAGAEAAARFMTATDPREASGIMADANARYVVVDWELPLLPRGGRGTYHGKFPTTVTWAKKPAAQFVEVFSTRGPDGRLEPMTLFRPDYYRSMIVRLYVFRGEAVTPKNSTWVVAVADRRAEGAPYREVVETREFAAYDEAAAYLAAHDDGRHLLVGPDPRVPCVPIEAAADYRLVHESADARERPTRTPSVRIFEYLSRR